MLKVLITDDSNFMKDMIGDVLLEEGFEVEYASSGEELLANYMKMRPDVVVLDIIMSGIDGMETLEKLMQLDKNARVLICSAVVGQKEVAEEAMQKGAYACLRKPFSEDSLVDAIYKGLGE